MNTALKSARSNQGKTQAQVAYESRISVRQYQSYEYGKQVPAADTAILIAQSVCSTVEKLFSNGTQRRRWQ